MYFVNWSNVEPAVQSLQKTEPRFAVLQEMKWLEFWDWAFGSLSSQHEDLSLVVMLDASLVEVHQGQTRYPLRVEV